MVIGVVVVGSELVFNQYRISRYLMLLEFSIDKKKICLGDFAIIVVGN